MNKKVTSEINGTEINGTELFSTIPVLQKILEIILISLQVLTAMLMMFKERWLKKNYFKINDSQLTNPNTYITPIIIRRKYIFR